MKFENRQHYVYIIELDSPYRGISYYVGMTNSPIHRFRQHFSGGYWAAKATRESGVKEVIYVERAGSRGRAIWLETKLTRMIKDGWVPEPPPCSYIPFENIHPDVVRYRNEIDSLA